MSNSRAGKGKAAHYELMALREVRVFRKYLKNLRYREREEEKERLGIGYR